VIWRKIGFFGLFYGGNVGFWGKNGGWFVNLWSLGKIGKKKAFENVRKRLKTFENIRKRLKIFEKVCEIFENIRKFLAKTIGFV